MTTLNLHRKLIEHSPNATVLFPFCSNQCNPQLNPTNLCSSDCINFCPTLCHTAVSSPAPSPATTPYQQPPPSNHHHHHRQPLSLPLKISLIFLFATFIYTLYKFYTIWFRSRRNRTPPSPSPENQDTHDHDVVDHPIWYIRTTGLQPSVINAIRVVKFEGTDCVIEGTDCSVCLTEFEVDDLLRLLPNCKHAFHISCIDTWLRSHTNCPLCRAGIEDNTVDARSLERSNGESGFNGERDIGVSVVRDGDQGEASGSSVLRIGETDEQDVNNNVSKRDG